MRRQFDRPPLRPDRGRRRVQAHDKPKLRVAFLEQSFEPQNLRAKRMTDVASAGDPKGNAVRVLDRVGRLVR
jgi:hypothetical protein